MSRRLRFRALRALSLDKGASEPLGNWHALRRCATVCM